MGIFRAAQAVAEGIIDNVFGEPVDLIPRVASDFDGFVDDNDRAPLTVTAKFTNASSVADARGETIGFQTASKVSGRHKLVSIHKSEFALRAQWPRKNDAIVRVETGERFGVLNVQETDASVKFECVQE